MALRDRPPREQALDDAYGGKDAYRAYVRRCLQRGERVHEIAGRHEINPTTLYGWLRRWREDESAYAQSGRGGER